MEHLRSIIIVLLLAIFTGVQCQDRVDQKAIEAIKEEDDSTIACWFNPNIVYGMHWYRQYPSEAPAFLLTVTLVNWEKEGHFSASLDKQKKESQFNITKVQLKDTAVYFCGAQGGPNSYNKIIFGSGTRLIVIPNLSDSEPSVYQLKSKNEQSNVAACLITDYSPNPIDVKTNRNSNSNSATGSTVVVKDGNNKESASLGVVIWGKNDDQFHCSATYKGTPYEAENQGDDTCSKNTLSSTPAFETDERLNLLSLTVLGLRMIFFKSVALNLILTYWAWSR